MSRKLDPSPRKSTPVVVKPATMLAPGDFMPLPNGEALKVVKCYRRNGRLTVEFEDHGYVSLPVNTHVNAYAL